MNKKETEKFYKTTMMEEVDKIPLPKDFKSWIDSKVFRHFNRMIIERIAPKKYFGSCQHCQSVNIELDNVVSKEIIKCPVCGRQLITKNIKNSNFCDTDFCYLLQKCSIGFVLRLFRTERVSQCVDYEIKIMEVERCFIEFYPILKHRWFHITNYGEWLNNRYLNMWYEYPYKNYTYSRNLGMINKEKGFEYAPLGEYCKLMGQYANVLLFLNAYTHYPAVEMFVKCKMSNLVEYTIGEYGSKPLIFNWQAKNLKDVLGLNNKQSLQYAIKNNATKEDILALRVLEAENKPITKDNLFTAHYVSILAKEAYSYFGFEGFKSYFIKSLEEDLYDFIHDYNDYFKNSIKLKRDMANTKWLKPYNFQKAHDQAYKLVESLETKELDNNVKKILKQYLKLKFEDDKYFVVIPKSANDIRKEGKENANCVGGYVRRVARGDSIICFIRHKNEPDKSFYTVEVNPIDFKIVQCRGYHNNPTPEEAQVKAFARQWQKEVLDKFKTKAA